MSVLIRGAAGAFDDLGLESPFAEGPEAGARLEAVHGWGPSEGRSAEHLDWPSSEAEQTLLRPVHAQGVTFPSGLVLEHASGKTGSDEEHWDPANSGLPLLATGPSVQPEQVSPNFTVRELVTSGGRAAPVARISPELVRVLQQIRARAGKSVRITSGYRSWARNKQVYAGRGQEATKSRHCSGQAADISVAGMTGIQLAKLAIDAAGTDLAIGVGGNFIHVDVRGAWTLWTYFKGDADRAAKAEVQRYRDQARRAPTAPAPPRPAPPPPGPPKPVSAAGGRLVVPKHPMLQGHTGTAPDLVLRWNNLAGSTDVDVVLHFHGFSPQGKGMRLHLEKEPASGLDFADPAAPGTPGRSRPTVTVLPRGHYYRGDSGRGYNFKDLVAAGALDRLIEDSLARVGQAIGQTLRKGRLVLTGHSGGGAALSVVVAAVDPDEVHVFDGTYGSSDAIVAWARRRIARDLATPAPLPPSLRILYLPGKNPKMGTWLNAESAGRALCRALAPAAAARLRPFFRVEQAGVGHDAIPPRYGWRLLADAGAELPGVKRFACPRAPSQEAEESEASPYWRAGGGSEQFQEEAVGMDEQGAFEAGDAFESYDTAAEAGESWAAETLAWLDVEAPGAEAAWSESPFAEAEEFEPEGFEPEEFEPEGFEPEEFEPEAFEPEAFEPEGFEPESFEPETYEGAWSEAFAGEDEDEAGQIERFGEFEDERDAEWESGEAEVEMEEEGALAGAGLTPAEQKAVEITSTFETGKRGGFYGLAGNFDGQGLSFGLVNWTIGTGSLQPLLRDFASGQPARWQAAFGPDAARFLQLISKTGEAARKEQHRFAVEQMNESTVKNGKTKWAIREPWVTYFKRLSEDPEFQRIQIRYVRDLLARGHYFCQYFKLNSEAAFAFMFDAVSSHGKWWLTKKIGGKEKRRLLIEPMLKTLAHQHGEGRVPENKVLLAIADVLGATSAPRWAQMVRERKRWFVTGEHKRARELQGLTPRLDVPYAAGAGTPVVPASPPPLPSPSPVPAPAALPSSRDLGTEIARVAEQEFRRWHRPAGRIRETDLAAVPILQQYFREGVGKTVGADKLQSEKWQRENPWSAVFVSWVMGAAGATGFAKSAAHRVYIKAARRNRLEGIAASPFWAYRATEVAPQVGDLVCKSREKNGATYDTIGENREWKTHCDIVTAVRPGSLRVVGGNVQNDVGAKTIRTLPDGRLALDGAQAAFFAIIRCRGAAPGLPQPAPTPGPLPGPSPLPSAPPVPAPSGGKLTPAKFVAAYGAAARASQAANGVPALVTLGQAALESGWGKSAPRFNFFGIKAKGSDPAASRQLLRTREVFPDRNRKFPEIISITPRADGKFDYVVKDWFRAFPDAATAFNAHGEFLVHNKRYAKAFTVAADPVAFAAEVARAGYSTNPSYARALGGVMQTIEAAGGP